MTENKSNCWEYKKCGREPGGVNVKDSGVCPAAREDKLDGVHAGKNGGRACWVISGTWCGGTVQGTFAKKFVSCGSCDFYRLVKTEESANFNLSAVLLARLKGF